MRVCGVVQARKPANIAGFFAKDGYRIIFASETRYRGLKRVIWIYAYILTDKNRKNVHDRGIMKKLSLYKRIKVQILRIDESYAVASDSGRLVAGGVTFPSEDVAREFIRSSNMYAFNK